MTKEIILPKTLGNDIVSLNFVTNLQKECLYGDYNRIRLNFSKCTHIFPNYIPVIISLKELTESIGKTVDIDLSTLEDYNMFKLMISLGITEYIYKDNKYKIVNPNIISFKKFSPDDLENTDLIISYIQQVFKLPHVKISEPVRELLISKLYEIFANALEHSHTKFGVFCCGQYFPERHRIYFSIYDAGVGIPYNVRKFLKRPDMPADLTLRWAFTSGNTTAPKSDYPRGIGLDFLYQFIKLNNGQISIYSERGCCRLRKDREEFFLGNNTLYGTSFNINIADDYEHVYILGKSKYNTK